MTEYERATWKLIAWWRAERAKIRRRPIFPPNGHYWAADAVAMMDFNHAYIRRLLADIRCHRADTKAGAK